MVRAAKLTVCFVALAVLARDAFASPTPVDGSLMLFAKHSPTFEIDKFPFRTLAGNAEWILEHLATILRTTVRENFLNVVSWIADIMMRMEFLVMADGSHFMFPACGQPNEEQKHKEMAIAVSKLLLNLKTMERTDELIRNVTKTTLRANVNVVDSSWEKIMSAFLRTYFETMDRLFEEDEMLAVEYKRQKAEAKKEAKPNPRMHEALIKMWQYKTDQPVVGKEEIVVFLHDKEIVRQACVNKVFMKKAVKNIAMIFDKTHHELYSLARALIKKASESSDFESKVNQLYHKALVRAGGVSHSVLVADDVIAETLFDAIQKGIEADPTLHQEIRASMKQIESNAMYGSEMLHFDFSPL